MDPMTAAPVIATAATLGVIHGIEPDHAAGILSLTGGTGSARGSALLGAWFAAGHVILVVCWVGVASVLAGLPGFASVFDFLGTTVVGLVLVGLGTVLAATAGRRLVHTHWHRHDGAEPPHRHVHLHMPERLASIGVRPPHEHAHGRRHRLAVAAVGALFTLSPPVSMLAFISVIVPSATGGVVLVALAAYAVAIGATMAGIGGGLGAGFGAIAGRDARVHAASQVLAAVAVVGLGAHLLVQGLA